MQPFVKDPQTLPLEQDGDRIADMMEARIRSHYALDKTGEPRHVEFDDKNPPTPEPDVYLKRTNKMKPQSAKRPNRKAQRAARKKNR